MKKLEEVSAEYKDLLKRQSDLIGRQRDINAEIAHLHGELGLQSAASDHDARVSALLSGVEVQVPTPIREKLAELAKEERAVDAAIRQLSGSIAIERRAASRHVVAEFLPQRVAIAKEFFAAIAKAAEAQLRYFDMQKEFHDAGVESSGFNDFGEGLFGPGGYRNSDLAIALRKAAREGLLPAKDLPEAYR